MTKTTTSKVLSVKVSPLNPKQWNLSLGCGHDVWITSKTRPTRKIVPCERCRKEPKTDCLDRASLWLVHLDRAIADQPKQRHPALSILDLMDLKKNMLNLIREIEMLRAKV